MAFFPAVTKTPNLKVPTQSMNPTFQDSQEQIEQVHHEGPNQIESESCRSEIVCDRHSCVAVENETKESLVELIKRREESWRLRRVSAQKRVSIYESEIELARERSK